VSEPTITPDQSSHPLDNSIVCLYIALFNLSLPDLWYDPDLTE
jgi:hypothetical protein